MKKFSLLLMLASVTLTGCIDKTIAPRVEDNLNFQESRLQQVRFDNAGFKRHKMPFVAADTFEEPEPLPSYLKKSVYFEAKKELGLKYYVSNISQQIGVPIRIGQDIYTIDRELSGSVESEDETYIIDPTEAAIDVVQEQIEDSQQQLSPLSMREQLKLRGSAESALNILTSTFNVHWRYDNGAVTLYKLETRTFRLNYLMNETLEVASEGSATEESGGLTAATLSRFEGSSYEDYSETIFSMLSQFGQISSIANSGAIVVTDTPERLENVAKFIEEENQTLMSQVSLDVEVVMVSSADGKDIAVIWDELLADLGDASLSVLSSQPSLSKTLVTQATVGINEGRLSGSQLLLRALASKSRVSVVTRETRTVLNNTPAQFRDVSTIEYPSETTATTTDGVTTFTTIKGVIKPGFDMNILPRITSDNRVILNLVTTMSRALPFEEIITSQSTQRYATVTSKELKTTKVLRDGDTAMVSGYVNSNLSSNEEGTGDSDFWLLGGGKSSNDSRDLLIIFVTPHIMKRV